LEISSRTIPVTEYEVPVDGEMSAKENKPFERRPQTCPGLRAILQPTIAYVKCHVCGGNVEIWSDEDTGVCTECGREWKRPDKTATCLEYCEYADTCRAIIASRKLS
jgi:hypothetical protein